MLLLTMLTWLQTWSLLSLIVNFIVPMVGLFQHTMLSYDYPVLYTLYSLSLQDIIGAILKSDCLITYTSKTWVLYFLDSDSDPEDSDLLIEGPVPTYYHPSVLLHCWLGHLTCKIVSDMTYNVLSETLNPTIPYNTIPDIFLLAVH